MYNFARDIFLSIHKGPIMLNLYAPINNLGYGIAGYNILKSLYNLNYPVTYFNIGQPEEMIDNTPIINTWFNSNTHKISVNSPCLKIWHQNALHEQIGKGIRIGFPIFELDSFSLLEQYSMLSCDKLFVCSLWARNVVLSHIDIPTYIIPLGVDTEIFKPSTISRDKTIFFNCGKWELRKGHDVILQCFEKAFNDKDNVELWMMCHNPFPFAKGEEWEQKYKSSKLSDKIRIIPRQQTQKNVYDIMKQIDCGIFPARAEGWNLELLEVMACGKQVIATNYSGHTEFCNKNNCHLIDIESLELANDGVWFKGQGNWASIQNNQIDQIIEHMRNIHQQKQSGELKLNQAGLDTANFYTWNNAAQKIINTIK
jgi:glycosyltransferase involved in cell wall biosynthesis